MKGSGLLIIIRPIGQWWHKRYPHSQLAFDQMLTNGTSTAEGVIPLRNVNAVWKEYCCAISIRSVLDPYIRNCHQAQDAAEHNGYIEM